jgi:HEPN domain-containing protein
MLLNDNTPEYWYELALDDEHSASILVHAGAAPNIAAYHYHQALEKSLKGLIAANKGDVPRIHDLERLFKTAESLGVVFPENAFDAFALIQSYYSELRYPRGDRLSPHDLQRIISVYQQLNVKELITRNSE